MIVKCEQCQTRFKIPDEKVTDKGVKVRCTKCGHTFRVTRESAVSAQGAPGTIPPVPVPGPVDGGFDPFERFGTAPEPPKGVHVTRPGFFAEGVEASRTSPAAAAPPPTAPWNAADSGLHDEVHEETTRVMPYQVPVEARPPVPSLPPLQGLPGPGAVSFRPSAPAGAVPGVPSVAPSVSPVAARSTATPPPVKSAGAAAQKPLAGAAPRPLAPPAAPVPSAAAPVRRPPSRSVPTVQPSAPAPAPASGAPDLFTEFFANPAGGTSPAPLPDLPPPEVTPFGAPPAAAPARTAPASHPFAAPDEHPFGALSGDLGEPPPDLGPAPEFDPTAMFSDPVPAAPPAPPPVSRPVPMPAPPAPPPVAARPLPVPPTPAQQPLGRPFGSPPTPAPVGRLAPSAQVPAAPASRLPPSPMFQAVAPPPPAPASAPVAVPDEDPFGPSNADLSEPAPEFGFDAEPAPAPVPAPAPLSIPDGDPFGSSGVDLSGGADEHAAAAPSPFAAPEPMAAAPGLDEFGPSFGSAEAPAPAAPAPAPVPAFTPPGPMDFGMIGDEQMPSGEPDAFAAPEPGMADPFAAPQGMADPFAAPQGMADPFAAPQGMADPFAAPQGQAPGIPDPFAAPQGMADPFAAQAQGGNPDPFATAESSFSPTTTGRQMLGTGSPSEGFLTQTDTSHQTISPTETGRHMLDLPQHGGPQPGPGEEFGAPQSRELIDLPAQPESPPPEARPVPTLASPAIARPAGRPADMGIPERRKVSAAQAVTSQVAYLTIAAGLLLAVTAVGGVYMKEGRVDAEALSPGHLMQLLTPSDFVASNVTNGLYDTRGGGSVFYVRGEVENRSKKPVRIKVQAALYDGDQRVKSAEGLAGKQPSPEELNAVTNAETAAQLRTQLDAGATVVAPGGKAPFLVVFPEYPQELSAFRLQVSMEPAPEEGSKP